MVTFPQSFKFQGVWRPYQQRVLDSLRNYMDNRKIHVVAAPGSGKTTLGLEIMLRLNRPTLVFAPTITIQEQWAQRFSDAFVPNDVAVDDWVSTSLRDIKPLTVTTYQALFMACTAPKRVKRTNQPACTQELSQENSANASQPESGLQQSAHPDNFDDFFTNETDAAEENNETVEDATTVPPNTIEPNTATANTVEPDTLTSATTSVEGEQTLPNQSRQMPVTRNTLMGSEGKNEEVTDQNNEPLTDDETEYSEPESGNTSSKLTISPTKIKALVKQLNEAGIRVICLDEAHHLKTEWWKVLTSVIENMGTSVVTVALTATPPYDSTAEEWNRYIELCGPIDEEILVPELVADGTLCPHQDFVYFNWPTDKESAPLLKFRQTAQEVFKQLNADEAFVQAVSTHKGLYDPLNSADIFLSDTRYLFSLIVFLHAHNIKVSQEVTKITGSHYRIPDFTIEWLEILLQGFIFTDFDSFPNAKDEQQRIKHLLSQTGHIIGNSVELVTTEQLQNQLTTSSAKLDSISHIVRSESDNLGTDLRMLILTDYIRSESLPDIGNPSIHFDTIGVSTIFETVRRAAPNTQPAILSGSLVVIPNRAIPRLNEMAAEQGKQFSYSSLHNVEFSQVKFTSTTRHSIVEMVTQLFEEGIVTLVVGTKSLLGEGWDAPCVNSLILASFVGSTVLSNQMRGRAIRSVSGQPDKTANVWHLVCMDPDAKRNDVNARYSEWSTVQPDMDTDSESIRKPKSQDFDRLTRRFSHFVGVNYANNTIESGTGRLSDIKPPYNAYGIEHINNAMLTRSHSRQQLKAQWKNALASAEKTNNVSETLKADKQALPTGFAFINYRLVAYLELAAIVWGVLPSIFYGFNRIPRSGNIGTFITIWCGIALLVGLVILLAASAQYLMAKNPQRLMSRICVALVDSMKELKLLPLDCGAPMVNAKLESELPGVYLTMLSQGNLHDKTLYADTVAELLSPVTNPRYVLVQKHGDWNYLPVPAVFGRRAQDAQVLATHLERVLGKMKLVYTRTPEGRAILLKARAKAFVNRSQFHLMRERRVLKKQVK